MAGRYAVMLCVFFAYIVQQLTHRRAKPEPFALPFGGVWLAYYYLRSSS